jgi:hypothetical protein
VIRCTVAIPVYNRKQLIRHALDSALAQDLPGLEILVVDNCSTDGTWEVLNTYSDPRLRLIRNETNVGLFGNFNRCLELARGEFLRLLCSDDALVPGCLTEEVRTMERFPTMALLSTRGRCVDPAGRVVGRFGEEFPAGVYPASQAIPAALWLYAHYGFNPFNYPSGILLRRKLALQARRFDTTMKVAGDVDFFLCVLEQGDLGVLDAVGCEITFHPGQVSTQSTRDGCMVREMSAIIGRYRELLEREGIYGRIIQHQAAVALGLALRYATLRMPRASRVHRELARAIGPSRVGTLIGLARIIGLRLLFRVFGVRVKLWQPAQSLNGALQNAAEAAPAVPPPQASSR